jgi:DNA invertase Pin-like site-specific DNA recombinase
MFNMLGAIAQFERKLMPERQREDIAKAKAEGITEDELQQHKPRRTTFGGC